MPPFSRELNIDSPSLINRLRRNYSEHEVKQIEELYAEISRFQEVWEQGVKRGGGNFNPRPARVCSIILGLPEKPDLSTISAAMLATIGNNAESLPLSRRFKSALKTAKEAANLLSGGITEPPDNTEAFRVALALRLDELRHLHMTDTDDLSVKKIHLDTRRILAAADFKGKEKISAMIEKYIQRNVC